MMMMYVSLLVLVYVILLDFDYVLEIGTVNDDDHVDLMMDLVWICHTEVDVDDHFHYHYFLKETVLIFCKHCFLKWMVELVMVFYQYVVVLNLDFLNDVAGDSLMVVRVIDDF